MCNFFSAIVKHNGYGSIEVLHCLGKTMSHTQILSQHNLNPETDYVAKVEYFPKEDKLVLDEIREPIWWDEDIQASAIEKMKDILSDWLRPGWVWYYDGQYLDLGNDKGVYLDCRGTQWCLENNKCHRLDGPAVIRADGSKEWWVNGMLHRTDGPAVIWADGYEEWWVKGRLKANFMAAQKAI